MASHEVALIGPMVSLGKGVAAGNLSNPRRTLVEAAASLREEYWGSSQVAAGRRLED